MGNDGTAVSDNKNINKEEPSEVIIKKDITEILNELKKIDKGTAQNIGFEFNLVLDNLKNYDTEKQIEILKIGKKTLIYNRKQQEEDEKNHEALRESLKLDRIIKKEEIILAKRSQILFFLMSTIGMLVGLRVTETGGVYPGSLIILGSLTLIGASSIAKKIKTFSDKNFHLGNDKKTDTDKPSSP